MAKNDSRVTDNPKLMKKDIESEIMKLYDVYPLNPIEIVKGQGSYVWDKNGQVYLDLYGGHAVISIGHTHPHYVERLKKQLDQIGFYSNSIKIPLQHSGKSFIRL